ncbi:MAG: efflux RND transporter permease subunit [Sinimarinibacterium flocculans]|uniref:efflux RND transporter permease subunit n=1 Tax=Sinimarinibacterium flocculans TaxID=985250 RepID=UPI003C656739
MYPLRLRLARWTLAHRKAALLVFVLLTVFFALGLPRVQVKTVFSEMLPQDDPFVDVYRDHPGFGSPLTVMAVIRHRDGDIYNPETLRKVWDFTRAIDRAPSVDHEQILSIATEKARYAEATPDGIDMRPLMSDRPPATVEEVAALRARVADASQVRRFLISRDEQSALVMATFIEEGLDYAEVFSFVNDLAERATDERHEVQVAGMPILIGTVYGFERQMVLISVVTIGVIVLALIFRMRNTVGVLTPIITSATAAIWAFGFVGWLAISVEPLLMVVPLLLTARSFSHSVQFTERYFELYAELGDRRKAVEQTMSVMMVPSVLGIITDILGIVVVAIAPIPAMLRHAIFCGMWAVWLIPTGCVLISLLLASLPPPRDLRRFRDRKAAKTRGAVLQALLGAAANLVTGRAARGTTAVIVILAVATVVTASQIRIGNPVEGSNLLPEDSAFNTAVRAINRGFPGVNTLEIVLEAKNPNADIPTSQRPDLVMTALELQKHLEGGRHPPRATLSFADYLAEANRLFNGGHPAWSALNATDNSVQGAAVAALLGSSAKSFGHVLDPAMQHATVSLWYADNKQETVDRALAAARAAVEAVGVDHPEFRVRLGTGTIALQDAMNRVVARYEPVILLGINVSIFLLCTFAYRSMLAGVLLLVPVNLANQGLLAAMHLLGVGLDVNTLIVAAIGVGVGIDYGIYLLSRICEEVQRRTGDDDARWGGAIRAALSTTGGAILFTASMMMLAIFPWYLMADLKFVADMGLLLMAIMIINMVLSLLVLPLLVWWLRPAFAQRYGCESLGGGAEGPAPAAH